MNNKLNSEFCKCGDNAIYTRINTVETISKDTIAGWVVTETSSDDYFKCTKCNCMPSEKIETEADTNY